MCVLKAWLQNASILKLCLNIFFLLCKAWRSTKGKNLRPFELLPGYAHNPTNGCVLLDHQEYGRTFHILYEFFISQFLFLFLRFWSASYFAQLISPSQFSTSAVEFFFNKFIDDRAFPMNELWIGWNIERPMNGLCQRFANKVK